MEAMVTTSTRKQNVKRKVASGVPLSKETQRTGRPFKRVAKQNSGI